MVRVSACVIQVILTFTNHCAKYLDLNVYRQKLTDLVLFIDLWQSARAVPNFLWQNMRSNIIIITISFASMSNAGHSKLRGREDENVTLSAKHFRNI